jgi:hypothetical protein
LFCPSGREQSINIVILLWLEKPPVLTENEIQVFYGKEEFELTVVGKTYSSDYFSFHYKRKGDTWPMCLCFLETFCAYP